MLRRLRNVLVSSFVGAIALGWVFAQGILHFAYALVAPIGGWVTRHEYLAMAKPGFSFHDALPEFAKSVSLFLIGYILLRWLYYGSSQAQIARFDREPTA